MKGLACHLVYFSCENGLLFLEIMNNGEARTPKKFRTSKGDYSIKHWFSGRVLDSRPKITERLLMGRKESNQTKKLFNCVPLQNRNFS